MTIESNGNLVSPFSKDSSFALPWLLIPLGDSRVSSALLTRVVKLLIQFGVGKTAGRGAETFTAASSSALVVQDYAEEAIIDGQVAAVGVIDKAKLLELIHEMTDSRPRGANHL